MLVLTRSLDEKITFLLPDGQELVVTLLKTQRGRARIGISAPGDIAIFRNEILENNSEYKIIET